MRTVRGPQRLVAVAAVRDVGLYNPHTASGVVVVDGVIVSCYTAAVRAAAAHALLAPVRAAVRARGAGHLAALHGLSDVLDGSSELLERFF